MIINAIGTFLETSGVGKMGDGIKTDANIFIGKIPANPIKCAGIYATGGLAPDTETGLKSPTFQVLTRGKDFDEAMAFAQAIYTALQGQHHITLDSKTVYLIEAIQEPTGIGENENGNYEVTCNYIIKVR